MPWFKTAPTCCHDYAYEPEFDDKDDDVTAMKTKNLIGRVTVAPLDDAGLESDQ
jgi:hypothetical protein